MEQVRKLVQEAIREVTYSFPHGVAYTGAVVEDQGEIDKLYEVFRNEMARHDISLDGWKRPDDLHMTICLGAFPFHMKMRGDLNSPVTLEVTHLGISDLAAAFKVTGYMSKNDVQHITMAFLQQPSDAKEIQDWRPLAQPFSVEAVIREVGNKKA
jgi:hypothetical protein